MFFPTPHMLTFKTDVNYFQMKNTKMFQKYKKKNDFFKLNTKMICWWHSGVEKRK